MNKKLQEKIYEMSNSFLPLNNFFNDIRDTTNPKLNKEMAYKDLETIADYILSLQKALKAKDKKWNYLQKWVQNQIELLKPSLNISNLDSLHSALGTYECILNKMNELEIKEELAKPEEVYKAESVDIEDVWEFDYENNKGE